MATSLVIRVVLLACAIDPGLCSLTSYRLLRDQHTEATCALDPAHTESTWYCEVPSKTTWAFALQCSSEVCIGGQQPILVINGLRCWVLTSLKLSKSSPVVVWCLWSCLGLVSTPPAPPPPVAGLNRVYLEAGSGVLDNRTQPSPAPSPALNCHPAHPEPCQPDPASLTDPAPPAWSPSPQPDWRYIDICLVPNSVFRRTGLISAMRQQI